MNAEQWARLKTLFALARELAPSKRTDYIDKQCSDDPVMRTELMSMLGSDACDDQFLIPVSPDELKAAGGLDHSTLAAGTRIGRYELIRLIATGGMGEVYLARRADAEFEKTVAVKIIRQSVATIGMMQRFHRERQMLASLDHPNITRLLDGETTDQGLPYLVMEYVAGQPIVRYCRINGLSVRRRLELFLTTCRTVQYAHQNLIVHRDIKPNNILVTDDGEVKLLDFGISRLLDDNDGPQTTCATVTRVSALTPEYSSPEQVRGESVTTATDVYSLGVVLYELLSGRRPYRLDDIPRYEAERVICEFDPVLPSAAVGASEQTALDDVGDRRLPRSEVAANTGLNTRRMRQALRGDLDTIVLTAMQKDARRRYRSVEQLADDIKRYFDGLPLAARKDTLSYQLGKFVRRNKPQVAGAAVACVALLVAFGVVSASLIRANQARRIANEQRSLAQAAQGETQGVVDFMEGLMGSASPFKRGRGVTVLDLLSDAEFRIESQLADRPGVEASVRMALARTFRNLMMFADAIPHLRKALDYYRRTGNHDDPIVAEALSALAQALAEQSFSGKQDSAGVVKMQREALAIRKKQYSEPHAVIANSLRVLAIAMWAEAHPQAPDDETLGVLLDARSMYEQLNMSQTPEAALCLVDLANAYAARRELEYADRTYREALRIYESAQDGGDQFALNAIDKYATFLMQTQRPEQAAAMFESYLAKAPKEVALASTKNAAWKLASLRFALKQTHDAQNALYEAMALECEVQSAANPSAQELFDGLIAGLRAPKLADTRVELFGDVLTAIVRYSSEPPNLISDQMYIVVMGLLDVDGVDAARDLLKYLTHNIEAIKPDNRQVADTIGQLNQAIAKTETKRSESINAKR